MTDYLTTFFATMEPVIRDIMNRPTSDKLTYDAFDTPKTNQKKLDALKEKQRVMKVGEIMQKIIGNYQEFEDLGIGHATGLDIWSTSRKIIMELKNRTNTVNADSKSKAFDKLAKFKKANPEYTCILACVNEDTKVKFETSTPKIIIHDGVEIQMLTGLYLLRFVFGENAEQVVEFVKNTIDKYT